MKFPFLLYPTEVEEKYAALPVGLAIYKYARSSNPGGGETCLIKWIKRGEEGRVSGGVVEWWVEEGGGSVYAVWATA